MARTIVFDAYGTLFDVQSVLTATEAEFPGHGALITQIWRMKQLEYTWLSSQMGRKVSFWQVSEESLAYALDVIGLPRDTTKIAQVMDSYLNLTPYRETAAALTALQNHKLAILSNGDQAMLDALVANTGLAQHFDAVLSVETQGVFKPHPSAYDLVEAYLGVARGDVLFVSSNGFDVAGAKAYGFRVAWIERVTAPALQAEIAQGQVGPATMFKALRMREESLDLPADHRLTALTDLADLTEA